MEKRGRREIGEEDSNDLIIKAAPKRELSAGTKNLPLTDVNVRCELRGLIASVVISQRYENTVITEYIERHLYNMIILY